MDHIIEYHTRKRKHYKYVPKGEINTARYIIGIDTGVETGLAVWDRSEQKLLMVITTLLHRAQEIVDDISLHSGGDLFVFLEDARLRKVIPWQKNEKAERGRREGAGYVKRDAVAWEDFLNDHLIPHKMVAPAQNKTKLDENSFKTITNWKASTSNHARDAAMLCFKR